jgi:hypothetical protein
MNRFRYPVRPEMFQFDTMSRSVRGLSQRPVQCVLGVYVPGIKAARTSSRLFYAEAGNTWLCAFTLHVSILWCLENTAHAHGHFAFNVTDVLEEYISAIFTAQLSQLGKVPGKMDWGGGVDQRKHKDLSQHSKEAWGSLGGGGSGKLTL